MASKILNVNLVNGRVPRFTGLAACAQSRNFHQTAPQQSKMTRQMKRDFGVPTRMAKTVTPATCPIYRPPAEKPVPHVSIPKRIPRSPTDILKALASTVPQDPTQPHYKYMDDPYLLPKNVNERRSYALSKESGRKAARYFLDKYPHMFYRDDAEPKVEAFSWKDVITPDTVGLNEENLADFIQAKDIDNAVATYESLQQSATRLSRETLMSLFELLAFHNTVTLSITAELAGSEDSSKNIDKPEERWFKQRDPSAGVRNTWNSKNQLLDKLYQDLSKDSGSLLVHDVMIQAMAKFNNSHGAYELFKQIETDYPEWKPAGGTYDALLRIMPWVIESGEGMWEKNLALLKAMKTNGTRPTLSTFNSCLEALSRVASWKSAQTTAQALISEMATIGIKPSLASWVHLMSIYYSTRGPPSGIIHSIMDQVSAQRDHLFPVTDQNDFKFFPKAMETANIIMSDVKLAYRIHEVFTHSEANLKLINTSADESSYYANLLKIVAMSEDLTALMKLYREVVPHRYCPEVSVMSAVVNSLALYEGYELAPAIAQDLLAFNYAMRTNLMEDFLRFLASYSASDNMELITKFSEISNKIYTELQRFDQIQERNLRNAVIWTGELLGYMIACHMRAGNTASVLKIYNFLEQDVRRIVGFPSEKILVQLVEYFFKEKNYQKAYRCLSYCVLNEIPGVLQTFVTARDALVPPEFNNALDSLIAEAESDVTPPPSLPAGFTDSTSPTN